MGIVRKTLMDEGNYYDITINGHHFKGSRKWGERWDILKGAMDYRGKKVIDLGTFMGFAPIFIKKYCGAQSCTGVDFHYLDSAKRMADAFEVYVRFIHADFDSSTSWEEKLGYDYDVVMCMSLFHWVRDKERLLNYLSHFNTIIYEGHQPAEIEIERFRPLGYQAKILGTSYSGDHQMTSSGRTIILFTRSDS